LDDCRPALDLAVDEAANCGGVKFGNSAPFEAQIVLSSSDWIALRISSLMRAWMSAGVPLGAHRPYQVVTV
jgi:hypothetical protein